jgi:hypothetical protein
VNFEAASPNRIQSQLFWVIAQVAKKFPKFSKKLTVALEILKYQSWIMDTFPQSTYHKKRENLWEEICQSCRYEEIQIIELGAAWGYATNWFLSKGFPKTTSTVSRKCEPEINQLIKMDSFDLFTGLPIAWRNYEKGFFSNGGVPPEINDSRVKFHVGYVEEEIQVLDLDKLRNTKKIILFDLDLHDPTLYCYNYLKQSFIPGDILYFDEAFDEAEFSIVKEKVCLEFVVKSIGHTGLAIAMEVISLR